LSSNENYTQAGVELKILIWGTIIKKKKKKKGRNNYIFDGPRIKKYHQKYKF
jgi:hypothetical protein